MTTASHCIQNDQLSGRNDPVWMLHSCEKIMINNPISGVKVGLHHLRRFLHGGVCPASVQISAGRIGSEVPPPRAIGVDVWDHKELSLPQQAASDTVISVYQPPQKALRPPLGHALARMLSADDPYLAPGFEPLCRPCAAHAIPSLTIWHQKMEVRSDPARVE